MLAVVGFILFAIFFSMLSTCGAVLLLRLWSKQMGQTARILNAAFLAAALPVCFILLFGLLGEGALPDLLIAGAVIMAVSLVIGLPASFYATRKLDRLLAPTASVFS